MNHFNMTKHGDSLFVVGIQTVRDLKNGILAISEGNIAKFVLESFGTGE